MDSPSIPNGIVAKDYPSINIHFDENRIAVDVKKGKEENYFLVISVENDYEKTGNVDLENDKKISNKWSIFSAL